MVDLANYKQRAKIIAFAPIYSILMLHHHLAALIARVPAWAGSAGPGVRPRCAHSGRSADAQSRAALGPAMRRRGLHTCAQLRWPHRAEHPGASLPGGVAASQEPGVGCPGGASGPPTARRERGRAGGLAGTAKQFPGGFEPPTPHSRCGGINPFPMGTRTALSTLRGWGVAQVRGVRRMTRNSRYMNQSSVE